MNPDTLSESELAELYDRYAHVVYHRCRRILGNDEEAQDAVHEVFAKVMRAGAEFRGGAFRGEASPMTWMYRISTNHCLNVIRNRSGRAKKHEVHKTDIQGDGFTHPTESQGFDHALLRRLLDEEDDETRACVVHTYFDDCTRQEVADLVGISVPTVRKRVATFLDRARRKLGLAVVAAGTLLLAIAGSLP